MKYFGISVAGNFINLGNPFSLQINMDAETPTDSLTAIFPFYSDLPEIKEIELQNDDGTAFWGGIVDEQKISCDINGTLIKFSARSKAAYLLDNEAMPQVYSVASLGTIFERHIKTYGFSDFYGDTKSFSKEFYVTKGMSEWDVLEKFCAVFLNTVPRVIVGDVIDASNEPSKAAPILFSNYGDGQQYFSISRSIKRCKLISEVLVRADENASYDLIVRGASAMQRGVRRKRYINAMNDSRTPASRAEDLISYAKKESEVLVLKCPNALPIKIGQRAAVKDKVLGKLENLIVSQIRFCVNENGHTSEITMCREEV